VRVCGVLSPYDPTVCAAVLGNIASVDDREHNSAFVKLTGMTSLLLIRHAAHDVLGKRILGRTSGVHLNKAGRQQAEQLADRLSVLPIDAVFLVR